ncbi:glycoside hydrolase family 2 TIM barrel-domain containing protein [Natranaeroarchaeum aerophilus]|uniref:Beta-galactosidase n=1 Tax=Natranaeroarchaeum aerophilus TaxID=2917711 RepID=A0AAE3K5G2_9EURY|nr:glycoside hydrolase family 2 TIM barrel-domain containing protein [Natranaeroarchaeum aerophilus]MCL9814287.1 hypothetical protein [Natranaeroarchaeum aerophilus]
MPKRVTETSVDRRAVLTSVAGIAGGAIVGTGGGKAGQLSEVEALDGDVLDGVRLTPRPAADGDGRQSLNGTWSFSAATVDSPDALDDSWSDHEVPAEWNHEGHEVDSYLGEDGWEDLDPSDHERGWYRREFEVSEDWEGNRLKLRFGAVYTHGEVWVNGQRLGEHDGGYTPFEFDVTDEIEVGETNTVDVAVTEETLATDMAWGTGRGGITRGVTLFAVPDCHLSSLHIETELPDGDGPATVRLRSTVVNEGSGTVEDAVLSADLADPDGDHAAAVEETLDPIDSGGEIEHVVEIELDEYETWDPVHPRLYDLDASVTAGGDDHATSEQIGIREIEVDHVEPESNESESEEDDDGISPDPEDALAWLNFEDVESSMATDESGNGNDGELVNDPALVDSPSGTAVDCAGDGHVVIGDGSALSFTEPGFSVQITFQYTGDGHLFSKDDQYAAGIWGGELDFWAEGEGGWPGSAGGDLSVGEWYTGTIAMDDDEIRLYVDGEQVGSASHSADSLAEYDDAPLYISQDWDDDAEPVVDEFLVFDTALGTSEDSDDGGESEPSDASELLINGESVTLRGVNWEEVHEDHGQSVPPEQTYEDIEMLREANINFIRSAHHPPSEALLDACDELGLVVQVEAPLFHLWEEPYDDDLIVQQTVEMVERDRNRASVFCWSLGNEGWPEDIDGHYEAAEALAGLDDTRPTIYHFDQWGYGDDVDHLGLGVDLANHHYPATRPGFGVDEFDDLTAPIMFGEFGHTYTYNGRELATDPGERDAWVAVFEKTWEQVRDVDACIGAAIWAGGDQTQPDRWWEDDDLVEVEEYRWGLVDGYRRVRPELWHVKKVYSPVQVHSTEWGEEELTLDVENRCEFSDLDEHTVEWETDSDGGELSPDIASGETGTVSIPVTVDDEQVHLRIEDRRGFTVDTLVVEREDDELDVPAETLGSDAVSEGDTVELVAGNYEVLVDRETGDIEVTPAGTDDPIVEAIDLGMTPSEGGESPPHYGDALEHRLDGRSVDRVDLVDDGSAVEIGIEYERVDGIIRLSPLDGGIKVEYEYSPAEDIAIKDAGIVLSVASDHETLSWDRDPDWSTYPEEYKHIGRPEGTAAAFPNDERPDDDVARLDREVQWAEDVTKHGSNDFRGKKRHVRSASLTDADDHGLDVWPGSDQHVRAMVRDDTVELFVLDRSIGGVGLDFLDRLMLLEQDATIESGTELSGTVTIGLAGYDAPDDGNGDDEPPEDDTADDDETPGFGAPAAGGAVTLAGLYRAYRSTDNEAE